MFGWLTGKPKSNLPEPTALQTQRVKQIEQLKTCNQNVTEIHRDVEYRVNFTVNGTVFSLVVTLPPQFPQEKPVLSVSPKGIHPWISEQGTVTGCGALNNFVVHSDLGKIIREIVEEFKRNPPATVPQHHYGVGYPYPMNPQGVAGPPALSQYTPYPPHQPAPSTGYPGGNIAMPTLPPISSMQSKTSATGSVMTDFMPQPGHMAPQLPRGTVGSYRIPNLPASFPQIHNMSNAELSQLAEDEGNLLQFLGSLSEVQQIAKDQEQLSLQNEEFAKQNLSKKPLLEDKKHLLLEKYDLLNELRRQFDDDVKRQDALGQQFTLRNLQDNLKVATMEAEEESEAIADKFLEGEMTIVEFKKAFMEVRTKSHLRRGKEEQISEQITRFGV